MNKRIFMIILFSLLTILIMSASFNNSVLNSYDFSKPDKTLSLSKELKDLSGITLLDDGTIFASDDKAGIIYEVDMQTGNVKSKIQLGKTKLTEDFEDVTISKKDFYLVTSSGVIYQTKKITAEVAEFDKFETKLSIKNNVTGLCTNPKENSLLLLCKDEPGYGLKACRAIYSFDLKTKKLENFPKHIIHLSQLKKEFGINEFQPTALCLHQKTGNIFILSSKEMLLIELTKTGDIINKYDLNSKYHWKPEGLVITKDDTIIIADKKGTKQAKLSFYYKK